MKLKALSLVAGLFAAAIIATAALQPSALAQALAYVQGLNPADAVQIIPNGVGQGKYATLAQLRRFFLGVDGANCPAGWVNTATTSVRDGIVTHC